MSASADNPVLLIKAVPGARRDEVSGWLGERLKVRVAAPPEDGKANAAICALLARELGLRESQIRIVSGLSRAEKSVELTATAMARLLERWPRPSR